MIGVGWPPLLRLAARIYRRHWRGMLFFSSCIAVGVAFLVGIGTLVTTIESSVAARARELLAADVELSSYRPFEAKAGGVLAELERSGHRVAQTVSFSSMLSGSFAEPFLVSVKAVGPGYPFYGKLETDPPDRLPGPGECVIDREAADQRGVDVGGTVRLGGASLKVAALLLKEPDRTLTGFNLAPRVFIALETVESTGLVRFGSRIRHGRLLALPPALAAEPARAAALKTELERRLEDPYLNLTAYTDADPAVRETLERVSTFFVLLSLVALLLGAVGMSSSVSFFLNEQLETAGTLRCLGLAPRDVIRVYGALCLAIGVQGGALGAAAGWALAVLGVETAVRVVGLTVPVSPRFDALQAAEGVAIAAALALALNAAKLRSLGWVPPLDVLRERVRRLPPTRGAAAALAASGLLALFLYAFLKSNSWQTARHFALALTGSSLAAAALILAALQLLSLASRALERGGFAVRHGLLALTRQRARTLVFLFTLSIGLTVLGALGIIHRSLTKEIVLGRSEAVPDLFLVDIQKSQLEGVRELVRRHAKGREHSSPLIRARLTHVNGVPVARADLAGLTVEEKARQRFLTREYNLTYKDELQDSETLVDGRLWSPGDATPQISLEEAFARRVGVKLGDRLAFDVQGRPVEAPVTSIRRIDWMSMQPNFFVVFPVRVLEPAPQTFIASLMVRDPAKSAAFRRELSGRFPNVSVIDLSRVLDNVQSVLGSLLGALDVLAWFCVAVGALVLGGTLALGRRERIEQAALYRTLGSTRRDLVRMDAVEFAAIGVIAFAVAAATSHALGYVLSARMKIGFGAAPGTLAAMAAAALGLPLAAGLLVYRPAYAKPVLESLREEA